MRRRARGHDHPERGPPAAAPPVHPKALLTLRNGKAPGTVECDANVGLLIAAAGPIRPSQYRSTTGSTR